MKRFLSTLMIVVFLASTTVAFSQDKTTEKAKSTQTEATQSKKDAGMKCGKCCCKEMKGEKGMKCEKRSEMKDAKKDAK